MLIIKLQSVFFDISSVRKIGCKVDLRNLLLAINRTGAAARSACQKLTRTNSADIFPVKHKLTVHANCLKGGINLHEMSYAVSWGK